MELLPVYSGTKNSRELVTYAIVDSEDWDKLAQISVDGAKRHIGSFDNPVSAAKAYDREALKSFGEYANLNFREDQEIGL